VPHKIYKYKYKYKSFIATTDRYITNAYYDIRKLFTFSHINMLKCFSILILILGERGGGDFKAWVHSQEQRPKRSKMTNRLTVWLRVQAPDSRSIPWVFANTS
jgi:hypothetical protein